MRRVLQFVIMITLLFSITGCKKEQRIRVNTVEMANYKIHYSFSMISNNHIGEEWNHTVEYLGQRIQDGDLITAPTDFPLIIPCTITEKDEIPDIGHGCICIFHANGTEYTTQIIVNENRGKYAGNTALWEFRCSAVRQI